MILTQKLGFSSLATGAAMGLLVLAAAVAAGRQRVWPFWLGGTVWGALVVGMTLTDCILRESGPFSQAAYPLFFGGLLIWPVAMAWGQRTWLIRWLFAQMLLLLTLIPAFVAAVASALCTLP